LEIDGVGKVFVIGPPERYRSSMAQEADA
jgi:hypothetical protein